MWLQQKAEFMAVPAVIDPMGKMNVLSNSLISSFVSNLLKNPLPRAAVPEESLQESCRRTFDKECQNKGEWLPMTEGRIR